jgi:hypothetical protein
MRVTVDRITFEEFKEATVAVRRIFHAKQKRIQRRSPATYIVSILIGLLAYAAMSPWWPSLDRMSEIRPAVFSLTLFAFPLVGVILFGGIVLAAQQARTLRSLVWRSFLPIIPTAAILAIGGGLVWLGNRARPVMPGVPQSPHDWYGTLAPHAVWVLFVIVFSSLTARATRRQLRQVWDGQPGMVRIKDFDITSTGVRIDERVSDRTYQWPAFVRFIETPNLLILCPSEVTFEILPKRAFTSPDDLETARALFDAQVLAPGASRPAFPVVPLKDA